VLGGKVAIVTGGGRGIGRAIAEALAVEGARLTITAARNLSEIEATAKSIAQRIGADRVLAMRADVASEADCRRVVEKTITCFGRLDILVNNAGRGYRFILDANAHLPETERLKFWNTPTDLWKTIVDTNVTGPFLMAKAAVPEMLKRKWGRIVNIGVTFNSMRKAGNAPYGTSKATIEPATAIWAQDLSGTGITVNTLMPGGATQTGMATPLSGAGGKKLLDPAIMGPPAVWLCSEEATAISGARIDAKQWDASLAGLDAFRKAKAPELIPA
ncbi:MAG: SDR family NAD(P)-dependent oxidoreductase, partial [Acetobacteraceae bacterium]